MRKNNFIPRGKGRKVGPVLHIYCEGENRGILFKCLQTFQEILWLRDRAQPSHGSSWACDRGD